MGYGSGGVNVQSPTANVKRGSGTLKTAWFDRVWYATV
jgi:hypothetical protein